MADFKTIVTMRLEKLESEQREAKTHKEMLDDQLASDKELLDLEEKMLDAKKRYLALKQALLNEPEARAIVAKLKDIKQEIKDLKAILTGELLGYYKENDNLIFEGSDGKNRQITFSSKVKETDQQTLFN